MSGPGARQERAQSRAEIEFYFEDQRRERRRWQIWLGICALALLMGLLGWLPWLPPVMRLVCLVLGGCLMLAFLAFLSTTPWGRIEWWN